MMIEGRRRSEMVYFSRVFLYSAKRTNWKINRMTGKKSTVSCIRVYLFFLTLQFFFLLGFSRYFIYFMLFMLFVYIFTIRYETSRTQPHIFREAWDTAVNISKTYGSATYIQLPSNNMLCATVIKCKKELDTTHNACVYHVCCNSKSSGNW